MKNSSRKPISAILIGAGLRGRESYGNWGLKNPDKINFIAVAEPNDVKRKLFSEEHNIPFENQFKSWEDILSQKKMADACLICTHDTMHVKPTLKAIERGYDILLEKPMAPTEDECKKLIEASEMANIQLRICHVLRYTEFFQKLKKIIDDGLLGEIVHIQHSENVAYWHFSHSYVRGKYSNEENATPIVLAKTCHDLDILYYLVGSKAKFIHSFGDIKHYRADKAPKGAPMRCTDGCPHAEECPFFAPRLYLKGEPLLRIGKRSKNPFVRGFINLLLNHPNFIKSLSKVIKPLQVLQDWKYFPSTHITDDLSYEGKLKALKEGPYGRCVYHCDNDVPDHQIVDIKFENGITATMAMQGHSYLDGRMIRIDGSKGSILGKFTYGGEKLVFYDHRFVNEKVLHKKGITLNAHGGGDGLLMESFVNSLQGFEKLDPLSSARASLESHLMGFAAEKSRKQKMVIDMNTMR